MNKHQRNFRIGIFLITAVALLVFALISMGVFHAFKQQMQIETYFNESVQGLDEGSPVKYRGVTIGHVEEIKLMSQVYTLTEMGDNPVFYRDIYVKIALNTDKLVLGQNNVSTDNFKQMVDSGLRIRLAQQGITGLAYLDMSFVNPQKNPPQKLSWTPKYQYIPSAASTYVRMTDALEGILNNINGTNFGDSIKNFDAMTISATKAFDSIQKADLANQLSSTLGAIKQASTNLSNVGTSLQKDLEKGNIAQTMQNISKSTDQFNQTAKQATKTLATLSTTLSKTNSWFDQNQADMKSIINSSKIITGNLQDFSAHIKDSPSQLLFSPSPQPLDLDSL